MRLALLSDIHSNLPALEAVLADLEGARVDETWCLGDVVGYGAQPDECADLVRERCSVCLVGNHDLAALEQLDISTFSPAAAAAVHWTRERMSPSTREFLAGLDPADESREVGLYHASPRDPVWEYVLWPDQAAECIRLQARRVSFVGHSHVALFFALPDNGKSDSDARGAQAGAGTSLEVRRGRWLINPGSVGQPRDGDPRAAWLELDTETWQASFHRVAYDIDRAADAIVATDLPEHLARRLYVGQ
ncbi:MAG TPA: metallophosphoesterase family protein [Solirubrobacterales bacterium]|nr:metallophosphoesterase family protein [Solirubrobacterales bacterium]